MIEKAAWKNREKKGDKDRVESKEEKFGKKKLLITASTFPRFLGDTEPRFVLDLAKELNIFFDVAVLAPMAPGVKEKEIIEGVDIIRYHYFPIHKWETLCYPGAIVPRIREKKIRVLLVPFLFLGLLNKLQKIEKEYDAVHAHWIIPQGIVQSFFHKPYLVTGHGGDVTSLNKGIMKKLKYRVLKNASAITVVSNELKSELVSCFAGQPVFQDNLRDKIQVLSMGCNLSNFGEQFRKNNYWKQKNQKVILFVGRLAEKKGVNFLLKAMEYIDAKLVIIGTGVLEKSLKKMVVMQKLNKKVIFEGAKNHEELRVAYASADIFVMPSITAHDGDKEGFGLVLLEAMASGLPVVAFRSGGIANVITHERNGLLAREGDAEELAFCVNRLMKDTELYNSIKKCALEFVQQYDYKYIGKEYAAIINQIMGKCENED